MKPRDWDILLDAIHRKNCILMLGPEINGNQKENAELSLTEILRDQLTEDLNETENLNLNSAEYSLEAISSKYLGSRSKSREDLQFAVRDFYEQRKDSTNNIHNDLASLPFELVINTTPDYFFTKALEEVDKSYITNYYNLKGDKNDIIPLGNSSQPLVYYLYGHCKNPSSLVLTENDLIDFLHAVISKNPPLPNNLRNEFNSADKCFLFLGFQFGIKNWYLRILLRVLQGSGRESRSFAMKEFTNQDDPSLQGAIVFFREELKIKFTSTNLNDFATELKQKYIETYKGTVADSSSVKTEKVPLAFICHASEDKEYAEKLSADLNQKGVNTWIDKYDIDTGSKWNPRIENAITTEADSFIVLQSQSLKNKIQGYVNKEIELALQRQMFYRNGVLNFIFPVIIDHEQSRLDLLLDYQSIDLTQDNNLSRLATDIKRNHQRYLRSKG